MVITKPLNCGKNYFYSLTTFCLIFDQERNLPSLLSLASTDFRPKGEVAACYLPHLRDIWRLITSASIANCANVPQV